MDKQLSGDQNPCTDTVRAGAIWLSGWLLLMSIEMIFRLLQGFIPLPSIVLSTTVGYSLIGFFAGGITGLITSIVSTLKRKKTTPLQKDCFYMASCIAATMFFQCILLVDGYFKRHSAHIHFSGDAGFVLLCLFIVFVLYSVFYKSNKMHHIPGFIALCVSINLLISGGIYLNRVVLPGGFLTVDFIHILANISITVVCIFLCFLLFIIINFLSKRIPRFIHFKWVIAFLLVIFFIEAMVSIFANQKFIVRNPPPTAQPVINQKNSPNVILITMDTTRADHISCYGYYRKTTPNIDNLADESLLFKNAYSTASWTLPAHASIFTGLYPSKHGAHGRMDVSLYDLGGKLNDKFITLAEVLQEKGYKTAGVIGGPYCSSHFGLAQGFNYYNEELHNIQSDLTHFMLYKIIGKFVPLMDFAHLYGYSGARTAEQINNAVFDWLEDNHSHPFFLFVNYFDPHGPFAALPPYNTLYEGKNKEIIKTVGGKSAINYTKREWPFIQSVLKGDRALSEKEKAHFISQYDGKIAYLDFHMGRLFQKLKSLEIFDKTMIIVTGDHGESFGEHELVFHNLAVYDNLLKVPMVIKYPLSLKITGVVEYPVSLTDVMPEILKMIGYPAPDLIQGTALSDKRRQGIIAENYRQKFFVNLSPERFDRNLKTIIKDNFKYIWASNGKNELYNLNNDPNELQNLVNELPCKVKEMQGNLSCLLPSNKSTVIPKEESLEMDKGLRENLKALGYLN